MSLINFQKENHGQAQHSSAFHSSHLPDLQATVFSVIQLERRKQTAGMTQNIMNKFSHSKRNVPKVC
jgi:hypothetical protein